MFKATKFTSLIKKLPSPIYKIASQSWIDYNFPRHIFIEVCATCNLSCEYCPREKIKEDMDFELFKSIVDECSHYGPRSFSLHLFGEPLLYPFILEAIGYIKKKNKRHTILLTTNGTVLNKFAKQLLELGVDRIIWSWRRNNFTSDTINILRKIGMVRLLIEETPKEEFEKWSKFPRVEIKHLHNYGGQIDTTKWGLKRDDENDGWPCYHLWLAPAIRWNGDITICCNDPNGVESVSKWTTIGDLRDFWNGARLQDIRKTHLEGRKLGLCNGCNSYRAYPDIFFGFQKKSNHN